MDPAYVKAVSLSFAVLDALGAGQLLAQATLIEQARAALGRGCSDAAIEILGNVGGRPNELILPQDGNYSVGD